MFGLVHISYVHLLTLPAASDMVAKQGLCVHVSYCTIARYDLVRQLNSKMFLRHPRHPKVMSQDFHVTSILCRTFLSPDWDHKRQNITKYQKAHDLAFIETMCFSLVLGSMYPVSEWKKVAYPCFSPFLVYRRKYTIDTKKGTN